MYVVRDFFQLAPLVIYVAECPEVGTVSQGYSIEEALANLKEATELYLEDFPLPDTARPFITTFEATMNIP
jgi:predicted RNase H-like HicB family nuclease